MSKLRRFFESGRMYFITCVTYNRQPILLEHADLLLSAIKRTRSTLDFQVLAWVIQLDHFHAILQPRNVHSDRVIHCIKQNFSAAYRSRHNLRQGRLWQHRYWDHVIRDPVDLQRHMDYIHYNPVKHGLLEDPLTYQYSSLRWFAERGYYEKDWGQTEPDDLEGDFGE